MGEVARLSGAWRCAGPRQMASARFTSTNTITLQEQLVGKDLPFLREALTDQPVRFALLKGGAPLSVSPAPRARPARAVTRYSTTVPRRSSPALEEWSGSPARPMDRPPISRHRRVRRCGTKSPREPDLCTRLRCPHFDRCFLFTARRRAAQADVVVVNHHLLMADIAVRRASQNWSESAVLPAYSRLVIDEGHHLESAASAHLGQTVTRRGLQRPLLAARAAGARDCCPALERRLARRPTTCSASRASISCARGSFPRPPRPAASENCCSSSSTTGSPPGPDTAGPPHGRISD